MKTYTKGAKKRAKKALPSLADVPRKGRNGRVKQLIKAEHIETTRAERPTQERMARGKWRMPQGMEKHTMPAIDTSADMVGWLHDAGRITSGQEQAARHWQAIRARYMQELPDVATFKSCIAGSVPGYDDGDGDPVAIEEYRSIERRMSRQERSEVLHVCEDGYRPRNLDVLKSALNRISGC